MVEVNQFIEEIEGYDKVVFSTTDGKWTASFKEVQIKDIGELMIKRATKGQEYMTSAINSVMDKLKFKKYTNKQKYDPNHFKDVDEIVVKIVEAIKQIVSFDENVKTKQQTLDQVGKVEPKEKEEQITPV